MNFLHKQQVMFQVDNQQLLNLILLMPYFHQLILNSLMYLMNVLIIHLLLL